MIDKKYNIKEIDAIEVIFKISERCNLNCSYCYYFFGGDESFAERPPLLDFDKIEKIEDYLADAVRKFSVKSLRIIFHGGEPMMLKPKKFSELCDRLHKRFKDEPCELGFSMQSNGTLITEEWLDILAKYGVSLGVSIDGTKENHDHYRVDHRGRGSYDNIKNNIKLIRNSKHAEEYENIGVISVVSNQYDSVELIQSLKKDFGFKSMNFLLPDGDCDTPLTAEEEKAYGDFLCGVFDSFLDDDDLSIRIVKELISKFKVREYQSEEASKWQPDEGEGGVKIGATDFMISATNKPKDGKLSSQVLVVHSNGDVSVDDTFMATSNWRNQFDPQNVETHTFDEYVHQTAHMELFEALEGLPDKCKSCRWKNICEGGDLENRYSVSKGFNNPTKYCGALKQLYQYVEDTLVEAGYPKELIEDRLSDKAELATYWA